MCFFNQFSKKWHWLASTASDRKDTKIQRTFFENWFTKLKIYNLLKPLGTITQQNYWSFYSSELIYFAFFTLRHPVVISNSQTDYGKHTTEDLAGPQEAKEWIYLVKGDWWNFIRHFRTRYINSVIIFSSQLLKF